jgi:hypothetical protein
MFGTTDWRGRHLALAALTMTGGRRKTRPLARDEVAAIGAGIRRGLDDVLH